MFPLLVLGLTLSGNAGIFDTSGGVLAITAMDDWESPIALRSYTSVGTGGLLVSYTDDSCRTDMKVLGCANGTNTSIVYDAGDGVKFETYEEIALVQGDLGLTLIEGADHFQGGCNRNVDGSMDYTDDSCMDAHVGGPDVHCGLLDPAQQVDSAWVETVWNVQLGNPRGWSLATRLEATGRGSIDGAFDGGVVCSTFGADGARVATTVLPLRNLDRFLADPTDAAGVTGALGLVYQKIEGS